MSRAAVGVAALAGLALAGCCHLGPPAADPRPAERLAPDLPAGARLRHTLVFELRRFGLTVFRQTALGYVAYDLTNGTFAAVCLSPVGVKVFEVRGTRDAVESQFIADAFAGPSAASRAAGADVRRLFSDWTPPPGTPGRRQGGWDTYCASGPGRRTVYRFEAASGRLRKKCYYEGSHRVATVRYAEYPTVGPKGAYPGLSVLVNHRLGFRLTARLRELRD